jgi:hypothetical protein
LVDYTAKVYRYNDTRKPYSHLKREKELSSFGKEEESLPVAVSSIGNTY